RHCALYFATVRAHTPVSLLTVSWTSRTDFYGKRVLVLAYTLAITCLHSFEIFAQRTFEKIRAGEVLQLGRHLLKTGEAGAAAQPENPKRLPHRRKRASCDNRILLGRDADGAAAPAADAGQAAGSAEYRTILPALPSGPRLATTVFLHGDTRGRPYKTQDFADGLEEAIGMAHVVGLGAFQYNHVWVCTMDSRESKEKLVAAKELVIKGKRCLVIDPNVTEIGIRIHWLPTFVTDGEIRKAFEDYGTIVKISREMWKSPSGNYEVETSTRSATIVLKEGTTKDELPD
ncbi:hypothetical protein HPB47_004925, partial [Ixodes persulcatus]